MPDSRSMDRRGRLGTDALMLATATRPLNGSINSTGAFTAQEIPVPDNWIWMLEGEVSNWSERKVGCSFTTRMAVEMERCGGVKLTETSTLPGATADRTSTGTGTTERIANRKIPAPKSQHRKCIHGCEISQTTRGKSLKTTPSVK